MPARILIADDEDRIRQLVRMYLTKEGFTVDEAEEGQAALEQLAATPYDLVILDLMLPEVDGWTICQEIRKQGATPVIMLSARNEEYDRILGFQLGADDYVGKPFSPRELVYRVKSLLRRAQPQQPTAAEAPAAETEEAASLSEGNLVIDEAAALARVDGKELPLTPKEYALLTLMVRRPGHLFTREFLLEQVWGYDFTGGRRTVDSHVKNLREKLNAAGSSAQIETAWGMGYRLVTGK